MAACGRPCFSTREVACQPKNQDRGRTRFPVFLRFSLPDSISKQNAGCRFLRFVIRHCSRYAAKTELCVTVISLKALVSFDSRVFTAYPRTPNAFGAHGFSRRPKRLRRKSQFRISKFEIVREAHFLLRKEVIQPQVPLRLPCYDFIPVTAHSVGGCFLAVSAPTSATSDSHDVTGGVYKARERIHGVVADTPLLAIPAS